MYTLAGILLFATASLADRRQMNQSEAQAIVKQAIEESLDTDDGIDLDMNLIADLDMDSLDLLDLGFRIEEKCNKPLDFDKPKHREAIFNTVKSLSDYVFLKTTTKENDQNV